jgi:hypothetical protein
MAQNICEYIRKLSVESCFELAAFRNGWTTWKAQIHNILGKTYNELNILDLGDHLSSIFENHWKYGTRPKAKYLVAGMDGKV